MFQILEFTEAHLATLTPRSERHGDDDKPAVSIGLEITGPNTMLDSIDPTIRQALYKAVDDQPDLEGIEQSTPVLRCNSIDRVTLPTKHEGWTLQVDDGIDNTDPMTFGSAKVDKLSVEPKPGGSITLRLRVGTSDLDAARSGFLGMHVGQSVWITLTAPKLGEPAIDGTTQAFHKDHPLFGQDGQGDDNGGDPADETTDVTLSDGQPATLTKRGRKPKPDATSEFIERNKAAAAGAH
jgi:hypothetical protein